MMVNQPRGATASPPAPAKALDAHYVEFFECFNRQQFFEAHEVLELLWLPSRRGPQDLFYKGLIQLAGAFVHLQKRRLGPAGALLRRSQANLEGYPALWENLDLTAVRSLISAWLARLDDEADIERLLQKWPWPIVGLKG